LRWRKSLGLLLATAPLRRCQTNSSGLSSGAYPREPMSMQTWMLSEELPDHWPLMVVAVIPQQDYVAAQVFEQLSEEGDHFGRPNVLLRMESGVEGESLAFRRNRDCRDGRDFLPVSRTPQDRGLPSRGPRSADVGDRQESAFIEKHQMSG